jgi:hypothetical protein
MSKTHTRYFLLPVLAVLLFAGAALPAGAAKAPSSDLLLPWFEVHFSAQRTTLFALGNAADEAVDARIAIHTNWGIPVVERTLRLQAGEVKTVNLRDWLVAGNVPAPFLRGAALRHVQAALTGQPSPKDDLFYSTQADPFDPDLAVGYVTMRVKGTPRLKALWGDYFWVDPEQDFAEGELLVDIDRSADCGDLCDAHRMRFIEGGGFDGGTKLVVWSSKQLQPAPVANSATLRNLLSLSAFHREPGEQFDERLLELLPVELISIGDLFMSEDFGWVDVASDEEIYVGVRYSANNRYAVTLQTWCLPEPPKPPTPPGVKTPKLDLEKLTNGQDADLPPGPLVEPGDTVVWEYLVTNSGEVAIHGIEVTDDQEGAVTCPKTTLQPGQSMLCTLVGEVPAAESCGFFYANLGTATGETASGESVSDEDTSHYQGPSCVGGEPKIDIEKSTNGQDADQAPGPSIEQGNAVTWTYVVTNTGGVALTGVAVTDNKEGVIACPKTTLAVGESMTCTEGGTAQLGQYANVGSVTGTPQGGGSPVSDSDPSHYNGTPPPPPPSASIDIEKATNGHDADTGLGPELEVGQAVTWTYVVTNTGEAKLTNVAVTDDKEGAVSCPKSTLQPGESMTCTKNGTAVAGNYANLGTVTGKRFGDGFQVSDSDPSHYHAELPPPCGACEGKVTRLTLRYLGGIAGAHVQVIAKRARATTSPSTASSAPAAPSRSSAPRAATGFSGTLGTEIRIKVDGIDNATMHTSCSTPIGPGLVSGDFEVLEGASKGGGLLCPSSKEGYNGRGVASPPLRPLSARRLAAFGSGGGRSTDRPPFFRCPRPLGVSDTPPPCRTPLSDTSTGLAHPLG